MAILRKAKNATDQYHDYVSRRSIIDVESVYRDLSHHVKLDFIVQRHHFGSCCDLHDWTLCVSFLFILFPTPN